MTPNQRQIAIRASWTQGVLRYKLFTRAVWLPVYDKINTLVGGDTYCIEASRRLGKSSLLLQLGTEFAIKHPGVIIGYVAPVKEKLNKFIKGLVAELVKDCPIDLIPQLVNNTLRFNNGSEIIFFGANQESYVSARGFKLALLLLDEAAFISDLDLAIDHVFKPALLDSNGILILSSTPPPIENAAYDSIIDHAKALGLYFTATIYEAGYPEEWVKKWESECLDVTTWQREYLAKHVKDPTRLIIPGFNVDKNVVEIAWIEALKKEPEYPYYRYFESLDIGTVDKQILLLGFYHYLHATLYITDEIVVPKGSTTKTFGDSLVKLETSLKINPYMRVCDVNGQQLALDLLDSHHIAFYPTDKGRLIEMVNKVNVMMNEGSIKISKNCPFLIGSLSNCVWQDELKKAFGRSKQWGHGDAVAALQYMVRNLVINNPIPADFKIPRIPGTNLLHPFAQKMIQDQDKNRKAFGKVIDLQDKLKVNKPIGPQRL